MGRENCNVYGAMSASRPSKKRPSCQVTEEKPHGGVKFAIGTELARETTEALMKQAIPAAFALALALAAAPAPAEAKGCLKGALVGGVAGHYAGHHGVLGAAAGCVIGRHEANKRERDRAYRDSRYQNGTYR
jgi:hypothetical protein